jgi:hypothetical protein
VQRQMLADYLSRQNFRVSALGDGTGQWASCRRAFSPGDDNLNSN